MRTSNPVSRILNSMGIKHSVFRHAGDIFSLEQAASERGQKPEQVVRSILFRVAEGDFVLVLIAGKSQISWRGLRNYLNKSRLTLATDQEVLGITGYLPGSVSPLGMPTQIRVLIDESVTKVKDVSIGSGIKGEAVILESRDLLAAIGRGEIGEFAAE